MGKDNDEDRGAMKITIKVFDSKKPYTLILIFILPYYAHICLWLYSFLYPCKSLGYK